MLLVCVFHFVYLGLRLDFLFRIGCHLIYLFMPGVLPVDTLKSMNVTSGVLSKVITIFPIEGTYIL